MVRVAGSKLGWGGGGVCALGALRGSAEAWDGLAVGRAMVGCMGLPRCESSLIQTGSQTNGTHMLDRQGLSETLFISAATVLCAAFALRQASCRSELTLAGFTQKTAALVCPQLGVNTAQLQQLLV